MRELSERRMMRVAITPHLLAQQVVTGAETHWRCVRGIPPDARFEGVAVDVATQNVVLYFSHPSFPRIQEGSHILVAEVELEDLEPLPLRTK